MSEFYYVPKLPPQTDSMNYIAHLTKTQRLSKLDPNAAFSDLAPTTLFLSCRITCRIILLSLSFLSCRIILLSEREGDYPNNSISTFHYFPLIHQSQF